MKTLFSCVLISIALCNSAVVQSAPSSSGVSTRKKSSRSGNESVDPTVVIEIPVVTEDDAEMILRNLGYNDVDIDGEDEGLHIVTRISDSPTSSLAELLRAFQRENGLEETGYLDEVTRLAIGTPHCGSKKRSDKQAGEITKWNKQLLTYRIHNYPSGKRTAPIRDLLKKAFSQWSKVTNLDFVEVQHTDADIEIRFGGRIHHQRDSYCSFDDSKTLAHAFYPVIGDIHFNSNYFFDGDSTLEDFLDTALHEIGHSLGLEHSHSRASLMHPTESNQFTEPQPIDVQNIQALYGVRKRGRSMSPVAPRLCTLEKIDAALDDVNGNMYVLAGNYYYDVNEKHSTGGLISSMWPGLPGNIDAAFRFSDGRSYFFKGDKYWRFKGKRLEPGHPRPISKGFPGLPSHVDAIFTDGDGDIFVLKGNQYWVYDPVRKQVQSPASIKHLGLPSNLDAALDTDTSIGVLKGRFMYQAGDSGRFVAKQNVWLHC